MLTFFDPLRHITVLCIINCGPPSLKAVTSFMDSSSSIAIQIGFCFSVAIARVGLTKRQTRQRAFKEK